MRGRGVHAHLAQPIAQIVAQHEVDPLELHLVQILLQLLRVTQLADLLHLQNHAADSCGGLQWRAGTAEHGDGDAWQELGWSRLVVDQLLDLVDQLILVRQQAGRAALVHVGGA